MTDLQSADASSFRDGKQGGSAAIRQEPLVIPTYPVGRPDPVPLFYQGRAYQGAKGPIYPLALLDRLSNEREDRTYQAVYLENRYVKLCVLPEIGGRLFAGLDKTNGYDFVYRQHVIKPALIGMAGAWISGGAEWDLPHHHRPSTFMMVDYRMMENADGSRTVTVGEIEPRHRMKWLVATTLRPASSLVETTVTLINRTPLTHSFLCFTNMAVHVNDSYQVIFPPRTEYGTQHAKREFVSWPIAHETYAGVDYASGVDVSWWKNHPGHLSIFAWNSEEDFFGGYDHGRQAGIVHVADHHVAPGKKFFAWGNGATGKMWDKILTDSDGPYLELMAGMYSDNQPDYSWIAPYERRSVKSFWYPVRELGGVKNANTEAAVNLEVSKTGQALFAFNATRPFSETTVLLRYRDKVLFERRVDVGPDRPFRHEVALPRGADEHDLEVSLLSADGKEVISYRPVRRKGAPMPEPVTPFEPPTRIKTNEELYLAGLRLEQFHNPSLEPYPYYEEALRRDPLDSRTNTALAILYMKRGMLTEARRHLESALGRVTTRHTRVRDGEPHYYLGLALRGLGEPAAARDALNRAAWSFAWRAPAHYVLAEMAFEDGDLEAAMASVSHCLMLDGDCTKALNLKATLLRKMGRFDEAVALTAKVLEIDPLDFWAHNERILVGRDRDRHKQNKLDLAELERLMRGQAQSHMELAYDYVHCGLRDEAIDVLDRVAGSRDPMVLYTLAHLWRQMGKPTKAERFRKRASRMPSDYCFPFRLESIEVLEEATRRDPGDARAPHYLGNLLGDIQPPRAIQMWEESRKRDSSCALTHRNLALAYARFDPDFRRAVASMKKAVALDPDQPRFFTELDTLLEAHGVDPRRRLAILSKNHRVVRRRDDALTRQIALHVHLGQYDRALDLLAGHRFHIWEGAERRIHDLYVDACLLKGHSLFGAGRFEGALQQYLRATQYPENFEFGRPYDRAREAEAHHFVGTAQEALGRTDLARQAYCRSLERDRRGMPMAYYQGLSCVKLGRKRQAVALFDGLIRAGRGVLRSGFKPDFFSIFGNQREGVAPPEQGHYLMALGLAGKGQVARAKTELKRALAINPNHLAARIMLDRLAKRQKT